MEVNSSGAELPAAMNEAPATSSARCSFYQGKDRWNINDIFKLE